MKSNLVGLTSQFHELILQLDKVFSEEKKLDVRLSIKKSHLFAKLQTFLLPRPSSSGVWVLRGIRWEQWSTLLTGLSHHRLERASDARCDPLFAISTDQQTSLRSGWHCWKKAEQANQFWTIAALDITPLKHMHQQPSELHYVGDNLILHFSLLHSLGCG